LPALDGLPQDLVVAPLLEHVERTLLAVGDEAFRQRRLERVALEVDVAEVEMSRQALLDEA
jgi:hypothetical protein